MKKKTAKHGGARKGAGRKSTGQPVKVVYSTKLPAEMVEFLRSLENQAEYLERVIREDREKSERIMST